MLTISNKSDIVLGDDRGTIFLLPKTQAHSRFEKLNRFSVINRTAPFLLEGKMINKKVKINFIMIGQTNIIPKKLKEK